MTRRCTSQSPGRERRGKSHEQKKTAALGVRLFSFSSVRTARTEKTEAFLNEKQRGSAGLERRGQRTFSSRRATEGSRKGRRRDGHTRYEKERKRETEHETEEWVFEKNNTQREREREREMQSVHQPRRREAAGRSRLRVLSRSTASSGVFFQWRPRFGRIAHLWRFSTVKIPRNSKTGSPIRPFRLDSPPLLAPALLTKPFLGFSTRRRLGRPNGAIPPFSRFHW